MESWRFLDTPLAVLLRYLWDLLLINLMTVICCFPIFTAGASISAMYAVLFLQNRETGASTIKTFFRFFLKNFWKATALEGIILVIAALVFGDYWMAMNAVKAIHIVYMVLGTVTALLGVILLIFGFTQQSIYQNSVLGYLKNSLAMAACAPWQFLVSVAAWVIPWVLAYAIPEFFLMRLGAMYLMWGLSFPAWITVKLLDPVYRKTEQKN